MFTYDIHGRRCIRIGLRHYAVKAESSLTDRIAARSNVPTSWKLTNLAMRNSRVIVNYKF